MLWFKGLDRIMQTMYVMNAFRIVNVRGRRKYLVGSSTDSTLGPSRTFNFTDTDIVKPLVSELG